MVNNLLNEQGLKYLPWLMFGKWSERLSSEYKQPAIAVYCVVFNKAGSLVLIKRKNAPFKGKYALPGGFVEMGETTEAAARRELKEETGLKVERLTLIGVYSDPKRDPRGHTISIAYLAVTTHSAQPRAGDDAAAAAWVMNWRASKLAFDHNKIVRDALAIIVAG